MPSIYNYILERGEASIVEKTNAMLKQKQAEFPDIIASRRFLTALFEDSLIYGTTFYKIFNPTCDGLDLPDVILLGINYRGMHLIDISKKVCLNSN